MCIGGGQRAKQGSMRLAIKDELAFQRQERKICMDQRQVSKQLGGYMGSSKADSVIDHLFLQEGQGGQGGNRILSDWDSDPSNLCSRHDAFKVVVDGSNICTKCPHFQ